ncbi:MAG: DUF2914 domain-containing protein [Gemmatimonadota bacterium]|nr:DUF2914 domain-containing protein [Gemmatimonadota bacterium]
MSEATGYPIDKPILSEKVQRLMRRYEGYITPTSFVIGFTYDTFTLKRIDLLFDNLVLLGYLLLSSIALIIIGRIEFRHTQREFLISHQDWFKVVLHLCMGSLFSAYTILYFKSAAVGQSLIFVGLIILILVVNEFVRHGSSRLKMLSVMHMFCSFAFFTFFLPVMTKNMDFDTFLQGGVLSLGLTGFIWMCIFGLNVKNLWREKFGVVVPPIILFSLMCGVYVGNWIPPVPLSVQEIGIYRGVRKTDDGQYEVRYRKPADWEFRSDDRIFEYTAGDTIFCFASVFAPTEMKQLIVHHWQWLNQEGEWITTDKIGYDVVGGRDGGWRGFTRKKNVGPGKWRIDVVTENEKIIARIPMTIILVHRKPRDMTVETK